MRTPLDFESGRRCCVAAIPPFGFCVYPAESRAACSFFMVNLRKEQTLLHFVDASDEGFWFPVIGADAAL